jgi:phosphate starvation-inducible PhoH-like protein
MDGVDGISFIGFTEKDVVRHPLVQKIVTAYDRFERAAEEQEAVRRAEREARLDRSGSR